MTSKDVVNLPKLEEKVRIIGMFTFRMGACQIFESHLLKLFVDVYSVSTFLFHFSFLPLSQPSSFERTLWVSKALRSRISTSGSQRFWKSRVFFFCNKIMRGNVGVKQVCIFFWPSVCASLLEWDSGLPELPGRYDKTINSVTMFISRWMLKQQVLLRRLW